MASRIALVTGANRGLGLETCRQLLAKGLRVAMTGRDQTSLDRALKGLHTPHDAAIAVRMDVTDVSSIKAAHRAVQKQLGPVDVVVNNGAILLHESDSVLETPLEGFRETFETNCFGAIEVCREFVPSMAERRYGRVVNVSSGAGQLSRMSTYAPAYSISKTALNAFTRILAATYRDSGMLANVVDPDGCGRIWVDDQHRDRFRKERTRRSGLRHFLTRVPPAASFAIAGRSIGKECVIANPASYLFRFNQVVKFY